MAIFRQLQKTSANPTKQIPVRAQLLKYVAWPHSIQTRRKRREWFLRICKTLAVGINRRTFAIEMKENGGWVGLWSFEAFRKPEFLEKYAIFLPPIHG